jgi:hypothetical protein
MSDVSEFSTTYNMKSHTPQPRADLLNTFGTVQAQWQARTSSRARPSPQVCAPLPAGPIRLPLPPPMVWQWCAPRLPHQPWPPSPTTASSALDGATMTALWKREWRTKRGKAISMMSSSASLGPEGQGKCLESRAFVAGALLFRCRR